jgi:intraflagellar transport protein 52
VRTVYYKYLHPKEVYIGKGIANKPFGKAVSKLASRGKAAVAAADKKSGEANNGPTLMPTSALVGTLKTDITDTFGVEIVYPRGTTLTTSRPAIPLLSSGAISYPVNRPLLAVTQPRASAAKGNFPGRIAVLGSAEMISDDWITKEHNAFVADAMFKWLAARERPTSPDRKLDGRSRAGDDAADVDAFLAAVTATPVPSAAAKARGTVAISRSEGAEAEIADQYFLPDTQSLSERLRPCLQESEVLPRDAFLTSLYDDTLFTFDMRRIPEAIKLFETLGVKHEPLALIPPQFDSPLPLLQPAVFPPILRELPPPALELFDLDEHFATDKARLAQLTNKWCVPLYMRYGIMILLHTHTYYKMQYGRCRYRLLY